MKIKNLLNLMTDATDLLAFFEGVETPDQLVSRIERIKRGNSEDNRPLREELLACIIGLQSSLNECWEDTIEPTGTLDEDEDDLEGSLAQLDAELTSTEETPGSTPDSEEETPSSTPDPEEETPGSTPDS